jgi:CubicO group peptidase (beta-lactamase class C family)
MAFPRYALCAAVAACSASPPSVVATGATADPRFQNVLSYLELELEQHDIPGASIAIVEHGKLVVAAGIGSEREDADQPVSPSTLFRVASLTKLVTAASALGLVERGQLTLDAPITDSIPLGLAPGFDPSTIDLANLLDHTSGVPDISASTTCTEPRADWFAAHATEPLWTPPGSVWNYSNRGYAVAGWAIEAAAGMPYEQIAAARVLGPAGMTTATFDVSGARAADHAVGHVHGTDGTTTYEPDAYDCAALRPAAGLSASVLDYASLAETLLAGGGAMLQPTSVAALETGHANPYDTLDASDLYGYGTYVRDGYKGLRVLHHEGDLPGYQAALWLVPDQQFAVVVLYDASGRPPSHVAARAVDAYLDVADIAAPDETSPPATWAAFAGDYYDPYELGELTVSFDGSKLVLDAPAAGYTAISLTQTSGDEFSATVRGKTIDLTFDPAGWLVTRDGVGRREHTLP